MLGKQKNGHSTSKCPFHVLFLEILLIVVVLVLIVVLIVVLVVVLILVVILVVVLVLVLIVLVVVLIRHAKSSCNLVTRVLCPFAGILFIKNYF